MLKNSVAIVWTTTVLIACVLNGCIADTVSQKISVANLQTGLRSVKDVINTEEKAEVLFYLENIGEQSIRFLPWNTALEQELTADLFDISIDGVSLRYQGIMIKRAAPVESDYTTLDAGERREVVVDLSSAYDMTGTGSYLVRLRTFADEAFVKIDGVNATIVDSEVTIIRE